MLNLFGGILIQKRRAEVALENSGLNYVIVRPGGMERPTDEYKRTHNVTLAPKDTLFGGQVRAAYLFTSTLDKFLHQRFSVCIITCELVVLTAASYDGIA